MKLAIMQPYLFPYIGYFQLINAVDKFVVYDDVNFINKGWINRNRILVNGNEYLFTLPLIKSSQNKLIKDIEIMHDIKWKNKFMKTLESSYQKAPQFKVVCELIADIIFSTEQKLSGYLVNSIKSIMNYLNIGTQIIDSSSVFNTQSLKADEKIIGICNKLEAEEYINPVGGTELYNKQKFKDRGINLYFLKTKNMGYKQFDKSFIPNLSIIDVLMFNSINEMKLALDNCELI